MDGRPRGDECRRRLGVDEPDDRAVGDGKRLAILDLGHRAFLRLGELAGEGRSGEERERETGCGEKRPKSDMPEVEQRKPPQDYVPILFFNLIRVKMDSSRAGFCTGPSHGARVPRMLARAAHRGYAYMSVCGNRWRAGTP